MAARLIPLVALLSFAVPACWSWAGSESSLQLEPMPSSGPFRTGDQLQLDAEASAESEARLVTVLQTGCWPWVLVRLERVPKPYELWINFSQVRSARKVASR